MSNAATAKAAQRLAALGNDTRLEVFRLLVKAGKDGLTVGDIGEHVGLAPSTLSHPLAALVDAGLVAQQKRGRSIINTADFEAMNGLLIFLTDECCQGVTAPSISAETA